MSTPSKSGITILKGLYRFVQPYQSRFIVSLMLAFVMAGLSPIRPYLLKVITDDYLLLNKYSYLTAFAIWLLVLLVIESLVKFLFIFLINQLGQQVIRDLRIAVFNKIVGFRLSFFNETPVGTSVSRTITDVETINDIFSEGMIAVLADLLTIVAVISVMLWDNWRLTLITLTVFPLLLISTYYFKEWVKSAYQAERLQISNLYAFLQEHITGMPIIQLFNAEDKEFGKFKAINTQLKAANINAIWAYAIFFPIVELISSLGIALVIWWGAYGILHQVCTLGSLLSFIMYISLLFRPLRAVADKFNTLQRGLIAGERIINLMETENSTLDNGTISSGTIEGSVEFVNVRFSYLADKPVLNNINFKAKAGETTAIVGATGSGKSTIINLLNRMYDLNEGTILVDDQPIQDYKLAFLRSKIGVVLQDVFLFSGSIKDNIVLNNPEITLDQIKQAAKLVGLDAFIEQLPGTYDFNVKERGHSLSLGQRQLISFIRAMVFNPSILVLDEATSSVDHTTELMIQGAIETLIKNRTSIIIAHRLSTIRKAHQIIVLDKGCIVEQGTHDNLIEKKGFYFQLYEQQFKSIKT
jgi:ATP-binding cassette, subfamily B, multidrug efflux pump